MKRWLICAALFSAPAHASEYKLDLTATAPQVVRMDAGHEKIGSVQPRSSLYIVEPDTATKPRAQFFIFVFNSGDKPFDFGPENIRLRYNGTGDWVPMATYQQLVTSEERRRKNRRAWAGLVGGLRALGASGAGNYSGDGSVYTPGLGYSSFSYSGTDNAAQYAALQNAGDANRADAAELDAQFAARMEGLNAIIRTTTVDPGHSFGGIVMFSGPKAMEQAKGPYPVTLEITLGDEVHLIAGTLQRRK